MNRVQPNFIIVGVSRCGTTSLFQYLKQHPEIGFSRIKEPKFFSSKNINFPHTGPGDNTVDSKIIKNEEQYFESFKHLQNFKVVGEASSDYFYYHEHTIAEIKESLGDVKIIICLRNPIERAYSAYSNLIRDSRETLTFENAIPQETDRLSSNYDWMWAYRKGGLYSDGVIAFNAAFSNVKVILLDDLEQKPKKVIEEVCNFLNVSPNINIDYSTKYSHSGKPKNKLIAFLTNRNNKLMYSIREVIIRVIPRGILETIASKLFTKDKIDRTTRSELQDYFRKDIKILEKIIQKNLKNWK